MKFPRRTAIVLGSTFFLVLMLFISFSPTAPVRPRPSPRDLQGARHLWQQLKLAQGTETDVQADQKSMSGLTALARDATGVERIDAVLSAGEFRTRASISMPLGLWFNASVAVSGNHTGFPSFEATAGRVALPAAAGRGLAKMVRLALRLRGTEVPPIDEVVQSFDVHRDYIVARVKLPAETRLLDDVIAARGRAIRRELVEATLCRIAAAQRAQPVRTLSGLVQRTFAHGVGYPASYNRASFVALSLAVMGAKADALLPQAAQIRKKCYFPEGELRLHGRADLAKHWVFSAALTSVFGAQAAENLGEWKELDDSRAAGSGFSFVDLAADRAGVRMAVLGSDERLATRTAEKLGRAADEDLMPVALLEAAEGLSDKTFVERLGRLDDKKYDEAVSRIDLILAQKDSSN